MDQLKKRRRPIRTAVSKVLNEIEKLLKEEFIDTELLLTKKQLAEQMTVNLREVDEKITEQLIVDDVDDDSVDLEHNSIAEYQERFLLLILKVDNFLKSDAQSASNNQSTSSHTSGENVKRKYKLPKLELKKFDGDLRNWLSFWGQFEKIDKDLQMDDADKFHYLIQAMEKNSEAEELINSYPLTAANYRQAVDALKERYGRENLLLQVYVRELLNLVINNVKQRDKIPLEKMYIKLESHLRALNSLNLAKAEPATWLFPLVESSLPEEILRAWQRSPMSKSDGENNDNKRSCLDNLMEFVKSEVQNEQQISLARNGFETKTEEKKPQFQKIRHSQSHYPAAASLHVAQKLIQCIFCEKVHESKDCFKAQAMNIEQKREIIKASKRCFICLKPSHRASNCKSKLSCVICGQRHYAIMCPESSLNRKFTDKNRASQEFVETEQPVAPSTQIHLNCTNEIVLQTLVVTIVNGNKRKTVRALLDSGSQRSYLLSRTAEELTLNSVGEVRLCHFLFGGSSEERLHKRFRINLQNSPHENMIIEVLDQKTICSDIPRMPKGAWMSELKRKRIYIPDLGEGKPEVELLIGSDFYGSLMTGRICRLSNGLTAFQTRLGWTISGKQEHNSCVNIDQSIAMNAISLYTKDATISQLWDLEMLGIHDPIEIKSRQEKDIETKRHFLSSVTKDECGRYSVSLPWMHGAPKIHSNRIVAEKRLDRMTKQLMEGEKFESYNGIFCQWIQNDFIEEVNFEGQDVYYLPHRAVFKTDSSTTPIRPVFDASCRGIESPSLNDCLEKGPNLLEQIPDVIIRFRKERIGFTSDIEKAFQMIEVTEKDRDFLRFLWWNDRSLKELKVFRHKRVVFGVNCSPFLLNAVIEVHLTGVKEGDKEVADMLLQSFYVDNCVSSVDSRNEYEYFRKHATEIMGRAKMNLRQWVSSADKQEGRFSDTQCDYDCTTFPVLGLKWNRIEDSLHCDIKSSEKIEKPTKRQVLSSISKVFDPIGFTSPVLLLPKLLLQKSWTEKLNWDEELPPDSSIMFTKWQEELWCLNEVRIPRHLKDGLGTNSLLQLHAFSDASKDAYAAVVFLRVGDGHCVKVQLVLAKTRVAPLNRPTIPRLELLGCVIAVRLMNRVKEAMKMEKIPEYFWTDSTTALAWIKRSEDWGSFVGNRIKEIRTFSKSDSWRYIPSELNPADLPSRGCTPFELRESTWWEGPHWLQTPESEWPYRLSSTDEEIVSSEKRKLTMTRTLLSCEIMPPWYTSHFSSYIKNVRMVAWILRFVNKSRKRNSEKCLLTVAEIDNAEKMLFRCVQQEAFPKDWNISGINVKKYPDGLLRVCTKLLYCEEESVDFRAPVVLPKNHPLVEQLIRHEHLINGHAGVQFLMTHLREKVWILQSRRTIGRVLKNCKRCLRFTSKGLVTEPAPLPVDRVQMTEAFQVTGVDLAGPLYLKKGKKAWIVLFTCAIYRCVHLDYVLSLSTEAFLAVLHRFICCRGRPTTIYSDNGTNFVGANRAFKSLNWKEIEQSCSIQRIRWIFNPPSAAWWGGWWERLIRTTKDLVKRMLGNSRIDSEDLRTCLATVESTVNQRPLTTVSENPDDLIPLTPAMFLRGIPQSYFSEYEDVLSERLQEMRNKRNTLLKELRERFRKEYLSQLIQRAKEKPVLKLQVGDVVLVGQDNRRRLEWPLARIIELLPGKDGKLRVARVKTARGELVRPLQRLYPLEMTSSHVSTTYKDQIKTSSSGRAIRPPEIFKDFVC